MINDLDMQSWAYLLDPTFQFVNTAGKPLTEGYLEVYIAGTRNKYYCASDFDGTLHPFQIPLDSLGANIVLADPNQAYDVYVYNRFGSLIMSRYNVSPGNTGSGGVSMTTVTSQDNTINITHSGNNYDLSIKDTIDRIDNLEAQYGNLGASTDYAVSYGYGDDGEFVLTDKASTGINYLNDMSGWRLKPGHVYQLNYNAKFTCDEQTNKLVDGKFYLDGNMSFSQDWNFNLDDSYDYTESFNGSTIIVVPSTLQYYDLKLKYTFNSIVNCQVDLENISIVDITSTTNMGGGGAVYHAGDGININNNFISVDMDYINEQINIDEKLSSAVNIANEYTDNSINEVNTTISNVSGDIINYVNTASGNIINYVDNASGDIINYVNTVSGDIINYVDNSIDDVVDVISSATATLEQEIQDIPPQVQSDWEQDDNTQVDYIKNKPNELELVAGENISIVESGETITISASSPDLSDYATHNEVYNSSVSAINSANSYTDTAIANLDLTPAVEIVSPNNTISVSSVVNSSNNTKTFYIDTNDPETKYYMGEARFTLSDTSSQGTVGYYKIIDDYATRFSGNIDLNNLNKGLYLLTANINCVAATANNDLMELQINSTSASSITYLSSEYPIDCSVVDTYGEPSEISHQIATLVRVVYDGSKLNLVARIDDPTTVSNVLNVWVSDLCLYEIKTNSGSSSSSPSASGSYEDGWGIIINGNVISVNPSIIPDISNLASTTYVNNIIASAINVVEGEIPDVSDMATKTWVNNQGYLTEQVQSNWTETNSTDPSYIKNKPLEANLVAGNNISITSSGNNIIISSTASAASGVIYRPGTGIDITGDVISVDNTVALKSEIPDVSSFITSTQASAIVGSVSATIENDIPDTSDMATKTWVGQQGYLTSVPSTYATDAEVSAAIATAIASVPAQVQSNWTESASASPAYIQNKPTEVSVDFCPIIAGSNITITASGDSAVISSTGGGGGSTYTEGTGIDITNDVISIDDSVVATKTWVGNQGYLTSVPSQYITETELSGELADYALKTDIPDPVSGASGVKVEDSIVSLDNPVGLVAGENITITVSGDSAIIAGQAGGGSSYTAGTGIDITNNVISVIDPNEVFIATYGVTTNSQISRAANAGKVVVCKYNDLPMGTVYLPAVRGADSMGYYGEPIFQGEIYNNSTPKLLQLKCDDMGWSASELAYDPLQVQANWNETSSSSKAYIQNKPNLSSFVTSTTASAIAEAEVASVETLAIDVCPIIAGQNVTITASGSSAVIDASVDTSTLATKAELQTVSAAIPDVSNLATEVELQTVSAAIPTLPQEEEIDFEEVDLSDYALASAIPDVSDMATKTWVGNQGYLTSVPATYVTDSELASAVSGLATKNELTTGLNTKQDTLTGITDVQVVQSLPASPVATVLYLIPEV